MMTFTKKYQVWLVNSGGYDLEEFDTLQEAITAPKTSAWYVTKKVTINIADAEEKVITPTIPYVQPRADEIKPSPAELDAEQLAAKYAAGPIGNVT